MKNERRDTNSIERKYNQSCMTCLTRCAYAKQDTDKICKQYNNPDIYNRAERSEV